jgi:hypothetical protein
LSSRPWWRGPIRIAFALMPAASADLKEDAAGRVVVAAPWWPPALVAAVGGALTLRVALLALRGLSGDPRHPFPTYGALAFVLLAAEAGLLYRALSAWRRRILFDGTRREVVLPALDRPSRAIPFAEVRGVRIVSTGRGYQWTVDLVTMADEPIELVTTGRIAVAKTLAAGLAARFGFAAISE